MKHDRITEFPMKSIKYLWFRLEEEEEDEEEWERERKIEEKKQ